MAQARPCPRTTSSGRLKGLGLPHTCLSHHQCRGSFLFAGLGARCYGDSRRCPLQVADTRPSPSLGLPLSLQLLLPQLGWQNHLVCDQTRPARPRGLGKAPLISPRPGKFPDSGHQEPGGVGGAGQTAWEQTRPGSGRRDKKLARKEACETGGAVLTVLCPYLCLILLGPSQLGDLGHSTAL